MLMIYLSFCQILSSTQFSVAISFNSIKVINECEQLRTESDASRPQDELEYWKKRCAQFSQIVTGIRSDEVIFLQ